MTVWHGIDEFMAMGGYALYVWGAYFMVAAAVAWERWMLALRRRRALDDLRELAALPEDAR